MTIQKINVEKFANREGGAMFVDTTNLLIETIKTVNDLIDSLTPPTEGKTRDDIAADLLNNGYDVAYSLPKNPGFYSLITEERARISREIEKYFLGLVFIPNPQLTKENLLNIVHGQWEGFESNKK